MFANRFAPLLVAMLVPAFNGVGGQEQQHSPPNERRQSDRSETVPPVLPSVPSIQQVDRIDQDRIKAAIKATVNAAAEKDSGLVEAAASQTPSDVAAVADARSLSKAFRSASRIATPSVVTILSYGQKPLLPAAEPAQGEEAPELPGEDTLTAIGSGVFIGDDGRIITNNHVIARAAKVVVQFADDTRHTATEVRGDDASDVGVLRIDPSGEGMAFPKPAQIGDSDQMEIGDWVLAIGSPFRLEATVSAGIISAKNRQLGRLPRSRLFQTDAAVNPGNSGGALVDLNGHVVGINTAIATRNGGYQGIGFAIPINQVIWIADELSVHGKVRRAAIGVTLAELNRRIANLFKLEPGLGVLAYELIEGSAAKAAGMQRFDVITHFAGTRVRRPDVLRELIEQHPTGSSQSITVVRDGESIELLITLASVEDPTLPDAQTDSSDAASPQPSMATEPETESNQ